MALRIDSQLEYLKKILNIPEQRLKEYQSKEPEEIIRAEAMQGNIAAIQLAATMFTDVDTLIELFQLADPENKMVIMNEMNLEDLEQLLPMLETEDLLIGLQFFSPDKILDLLEKLPIEELVKVVFEMFAPEQVITYMKEEDLDKVLTSYELDKSLVQNCLKYIPEVYLRQILESVTGEAAEGNRADLSQKICLLSPDKYKDALTNLPLEMKQRLVTKITSFDKKLFNNFDASSYTAIIGRERQKPDIIKSMKVIKPEYLQDMIKQLPRNLLTVVITQIDTEKFAQMLIHQHPEVLAKFIRG